jgi:hypothetical protein
VQGVGEAGDEVAGGVEVGVGRGVHPADVGGVVAGTGVGGGVAGPAAEVVDVEDAAVGGVAADGADLVADDDVQAGLLGDLARRGGGEGLAQLDPPPGQGPPSRLGRVGAADQQQAAGGVGDDPADARDDPRGPGSRPTVTLRHTSHISITRSRIPVVVRTRSYSLDIRSSADDREEPTVDVKKLGIIVGVVFALFFVISQPQESADLVLNILNILGDALSNIVEFIRALF